MPNHTKAAREAQREARRSDVDARRLKRHGAYIIQAISAVYWRGEVLVEPDDFSSVVLATDWSLSGCSRAEAAAHEVGHFVAAERMGWSAHEATIWGARGVQNDWGGEAADWGSPEGWVDGRWTDPDDFARKAVILLSGPIAGVMHGGGVLEHHVGELMGARIYAEHRVLLAQRAGVAGLTAGVVWEGTVRDAVGIAEVYSRPIVDLAGMLHRRKRIHTYMPSVRKALAGITPHDPHWPEDVSLSAEGEKLVRRVLHLTPRVDRIIERGSTRAARLEVGW